VAEEGKASVPSLRSNERIGRPEKLKEFLDNVKTNEGKEWIYEKAEIL
jgi:hypothetical protein